ncbi:hypothetical protein [Chlorobium sp.]|uniref:hypothetical protein n=1 Tax=Chlorobium sp. TaxID=1095 RepID=UPI003C64253A
MTATTGDELAVSGAFFFFAGAFFAGVSVFTVLAGFAAFSSLFFAALAVLFRAAGLTGVSFSTAFFAMMVLSSYDQLLA